MSAKKLLNGIEDCVDEGLNALVAMNPSLSLVKNHRVIVRSDVEKVRGKVALLCGGGSGHGEYLQLQTQHWADFNNNYKGYFFIRRAGLFRVCGSWLSERGSSWVCIRIATANCNSGCAHDTSEHQSIRNPCGIPLEYCEFHIGI